MTPLAVIRPDDWNWLLFAHLLAAVALLGGLLMVAVLSFLLRDVAAADAVTGRRFTLRTVAFLLWPALIATAVLGHALVDKEKVEGTWIDVATPLTELGGLVGLILLTVFAWIALRRTRRGEEAGTAGAIPTLVASFMLVMFVAVIFLMSAKPGLGYEG